MREDGVWGPRWSERGPSGGKRLRGGAAEVQLGLRPGRQPCGCLLPQPTPQVCSCDLPPIKWAMAGAWLLLLLALGCPALPTGESPPCFSLCAPLVCPKPPSASGCPRVGEMQGGRTEALWPLRRVSQEAHLPFPIALYLPATWLWGPESCSPRVHSVGWRYREKKQAGWVSMGVGWRSQGCYVIWSDGTWAILWGPILPFLSRSPALGVPFPPGFSVPPYQWAVRRSPKASVTSTCMYPQASNDQG